MPMRGLAAYVRENLSRTVPDSVYSPPKHIQLSTARVCTSKLCDGRSRLQELDRVSKRTYLAFSGF